MPHVIVEYSANIEKEVTPQRLVEMFEAHRDKLTQVAHDKRYDMTPDNPFPAVKFNSDRLHQEMLLLIESLPTHQRHRILSWFLL